MKLSDQQFIIALDFWNGAHLKIRLKLAVGHQRQRAKVDVITWIIIERNM